MTTYVYFVQDQSKNIGRIKIGYSFQLQDRLKRMAWYYGCSLKVLGVIKGGRELEGMLHTRFRKYRHGLGEWFSASPDIIGFIEEHCEPYQGEAFINWPPENKHVYTQPKSDKIRTKLREIMIARNIKRMQIMRGADLSYPTIVRWENSTVKQLDFDTVKKLKDFLNVTDDELYEIVED